MTQLQEFLFGLSFGEIKTVRDYMLRKYNVACGSMNKLETAIQENIPNEEILSELVKVLR